jgi:hypothetical protein
MHTDTLIWLFPVVFMLHDFEEIIMMAPWIRKNHAELEARFPRLAPRAFGATGDLSTPAFALAVAILFAAISVLTILVVELRLYALWGAMLLVFAVQFVMHIGQWAVMRRYVPVILTSIPGAIYCGYALWHAFAVLHVSWGEVLLNTVIVMIAAAGVFIPAVRIAKRFDRWLARYSG